MDGRRTRAKQRGGGGGQYCSIEAIQMASFHGSFKQDDSRQTQWIVHNTTDCHHRPHSRHQRHRNKNERTLLCHVVTTDALPVWPRHAGDTPCWPPHAEGSPPPGFPPDKVRTHAASVALLAQYSRCMIKLLLLGMKTRPFRPPPTPAARVSAIFCNAYCRTPR